MNRIIERFASTYTYQRRAAQVLDKGRTAPATLAAPVSFRASIQPLSGRDRLLLPEGDRDRDFIRIYTDTQLTMESQAARTLGDLVSYGGRTWQVTESNDWNLNDYAHFKFVAVALENDNA